jgi:hypothetical protein
VGEFGFELGEEVGGFLEGSRVGFVLDGGAELGQACGAEGAGAAAEIMGAGLKGLGVVAGGGGFHLADGRWGIGEEEVDQFRGGAGGAGLVQAMEGGDWIGVECLGVGGGWGWGGWGWGWGEGVLGGALEGFHERLDADGFADVIVHAGFEAAFAGATDGVCGHGDDMDVWLRCRMLLFATADFACGFEAVEEGQLTIHEDDVIGDVAEGLKNLTSGGDGFGLESEAIEEGDRDALIDGVVFGDEDVEGTGGGFGFEEAWAGGGMAVEPESGFVLGGGGHEADDAVAELLLPDGFGEEGTDAGCAEEGGIVA